MEFRSFFKPVTVVPVFLTLFLVLIAIILWLNRDYSSRLIFLAVGQGDCAMYEQNDGVRVLIDAGPDEAVTNRLSRILPWWDRRLDVLILTHEHSDHVGGALSVLKRFKVGKVLAPTEVVGTPELLPIVKELKKRSIPLELIDDKYVLHFSASSSLALWPDHGVGANEHSLVGLLDENGSRALLMADAGVVSEVKINKELPTLKVDLLKIGHHGSDTASSEDFLKKIKPRIAVISVGRDNRFSLPSGRVLKRLERLGVSYARTDEVGDIVYEPVGGRWLAQ